MNRIKRAIVLGSFLGLGVMGGFILAGKLVSTSPTDTAPPQAMPGALQRPQVAAGALPDLSSVAERAVLSSANISSTQFVRVQSNPIEDLIFGRRGGDMVQPSQSLGSGVIVSADGYVLTNNHVIGDDRGLRVEGLKIKVTLPDGREMDGTIVGTDPATDLALVKVNATGLTPFAWGDSSKLRIAEWVLAIGNPYQFNQSVSLGIVSALARPDQFVDFIQTDAAINPGNSGGALVNARGELVGINTQIFSQSGGYEGIGFAIPSNLARDVMADFIKYGEVRRGSIVGLGQLRALTLEETRETRIATIPGVLIQNMYRNSTAYQAGLRPGDLIVAVNGRDVTDLAGFSRLVAAERSGTTAKVDVVRQNRRVTLDVPIEQMPSRR
ncbi:MAG: trypsin-like serine protease [Acidobacteria bacterium]|nr:trypsin-like serine protease [Acidobacteriota bacterium]